MGISKMLDQLVGRALIRIEGAAVRVGAIEVYDSRGRRIKRPKKALRALEAMRNEEPEPRPAPPPAPRPPVAVPQYVYRQPALVKSPRRMMITPRRPRISR